MDSVAKISALLAFGTGFLAQHATASQSHPLSIDDRILARSALLVEAKTGRVIFSREPDQLHQPASTIKLLTALVTAEETGLRGMAKVNTRDIAISTPGASTANLRDGSMHSVFDLTRLLLVRSSNDVASVLAAHVAGNEAAFVRKMQIRARELGALSTVVRNPHGLPDSQQLTTARDLLRIFQAVLANPTLRSFCQEPLATINTVNGPVTFANTNKLLRTYPGMGPAKTGYTRSARHTYVASACRNGRELHLVLLNSPNKWADARALFDHGFAVLEGRNPVASHPRPANNPPAEPPKPAQVVRKAVVVHKKVPEATPFDEIVAGNKLPKRRAAVQEPGDR